MQKKRPTIHVQLNTECLEQQIYLRPENVTQLLVVMV